MDEILLSGPRGKTSRSYEVEKGRHTESYIIAVRGNNDKEERMIPVDEIKKDYLPPSAPLLEGEHAKLVEPREKFGYTVAEMERYRNDPFWKTIRLWKLVVTNLNLSQVGAVCAVLVVMDFDVFGCRSYRHPQSGLYSKSNTTLVAEFHSISDRLLYNIRIAVAKLYHENIPVKSIAYKFCYKIWTPSFQDSNGDGVGDFVGVTNRLENLRRLGVQVIWLNPFLLSDNFNDAVQDHLTVDSKMGTNDDVYELINAVHDKGLKIVISLPVSVTSKNHDWYYRSSQASLPEYANFSDYYHWRKTAEDTSFMSKYKGVSYIHYKNQPDWPILNWQSASVHQSMFNIMSYWIDKGIDGFYLSGIEYLARMKSGSETWLFVKDWSHILDILRDIRNHVDTYVKESSSVDKTKQIVLFAARDNASENEKKDLVWNGLNSVINYELGSIGKGNHICHRNDGNVAGCIHEILTELVQFHVAENISAMWEFGNPQLSRIASRVKSQQQAELLTMLQLLLPGSSSIYYGDEIGMMDLPTDKSVPVQRGVMQWDDSANAGFSSAVSSSIPVHPDFADNNWDKQYGSSRSHLKTFQKIARLRKTDETLNFGHTNIGRLTNSSFTITRYDIDEDSSAGNAYLGAFNFGENVVVLPIQETNAPKIKQLHHAMVVASSSNAVQYRPREVIDLSSGTVTVHPEQGVIFKFTF
uniref:alpha-glucosidase n=1 Tax=Setaria digitata TaxID=48799 RepID=A0A915PSG3_9BILA